MTEESISLKDMLIHGYLMEILFSDFQMNTEYEIMLLDFTNAKEHKDNRKTFHYMIIDGYSMLDYQFPPLMSNRKVIFHFSIPTFMFAWQRAGITNLNTDKRYNLYLKFNRISKKKFIILEAKINEIY